MITLTVGEFKRKFSKVLDDIRKGEEIVICFGRKKQKIAVLVPFNQYYKKNKRKLGILEDRASYSISKDFKITDEEFLDS